MTDNRYVYGATCTFMGTIDKVGKTDSTPSIPCCPHCKGVLFEESIEEWWNSAKKFETEMPCPGYVDFLKWVEEQPKCTQHLKDLAGEYNKTFNKKVSW